MAETDNIDEKAPQKLVMLTLLSRAGHPSTSENGQGLFCTSLYVARSRPARHRVLINSGSVTPHPDYQSPLCTNSSFSF